MVVQASEEQMLELEQQRLQQDATAAVTKGTTGHTVRRGMHITPDSYYDSYYFLTPTCSLEHRCPNDSTIGITGKLCQRYAELCAIACNCDARNLQFKTKQHLNSIDVGLMSCGQVFAQAQHLQFTVRQLLLQARNLWLLRLCCWRRTRLRSKG